jgi:hypothetical protein
LEDNQLSVRILKLQDPLTESEEKAIWLADDKRWPHHHPITFAFCLIGWWQRQTTSPANHTHLLEKSGKTCTRLRNGLRPKVSPACSPRAGEKQNGGRVDKKRATVSASFLFVCTGCTMFSTNMYTSMCYRVQKWFRKVGLVRYSSFTHCCFRVTIDSVITMVTLNW